MEDVLAAARNSAGGNGSVAAADPLELVRTESDLLVGNLREPGRDVGHQKTDAEQVRLESISYQIKTV